MKCERGEGRGAQACVRRGDEERMGGSVASGGVVLMPTWKRYINNHIHIIHIQYTFYH